MDRFGKILVIVMLLAGVLQACAAAPTATLQASPAGTTPSGPALMIDMGSGAPAPGQTITVPVKVQNVEKLIAVEIHLSFDHERLEVLEVKNGDVLQADFTVQNAFENSSGTIDFAIAQIGRPPASGNGTLFTITFRVRASGDAWVKFRSTDAVPGGALLSDPDGKAIETGLVNGAVTIP